MTLSHRLRAAGGGSPAVDLASFFGVDPTVSTDVKMQYLQEHWSMTYAQPTGGWSDFYSGNAAYSNAGTFISAVGVTATDNLGMWKSTASGVYAQPTSLQVVNYVPSWGTTGSSQTAYWSGAYSPTDVVSFNTETLGGYISSGAYSQGVDSYITLRFNNGLRDNSNVNALGFVVQAYGTYSAGYFSYHHSPIFRFECNGVAATFAPKGYVGINSNTTAGHGRAGYVLYPCLFDDTTFSDLNSHFMYPNVSGNTLPSSYFVY